MASDRHPLHPVAVEIMAPMCPADEGAQRTEGMMELAGTIAEAVEVAVEVVGRDLAHARVTEPELPVQMTLVAFIGGGPEPQPHFAEIFRHGASPAFGEGLMLAERVFGKEALCLLARVLKIYDSYAADGLAPAPWPVR
jgi:hypothetical protein